MEKYIIFGHRYATISIYNDLTDNLVTQISLTKTQVYNINKVLNLDEYDPEYLCDSYRITLSQCDKAKIWIPKYYRNKNFVYFFELDF